MTTNEQKDREEFEAAAREIYQWLDGMFALYTKPNAERTYNHYDVEDAWKLWRARSRLSGWVKCSERMPEPETDCLVLLCWDGQPPHICIDTWRMGTERPLEFSSATIETGLEWAEYDYDEITHWMPLPPAPGSEEKE